MKIGFYYPYTFAGVQGAANAVRGLGQALGSFGADVTFLVDDAVDQGIEPKSADTVVAVRHAGPGRARIPVGLRAITRGRFDVVGVTSAWVPGKVIAAFAAHRAGASVVLSPQGAFHPRVVSRNRGVKALYWRTIEKPHVDRVDVVHVLFEDERRDLEAAGVRKPVIVAPNGVDADQPIWDGGSQPTVVWLGRYDVECKGLDLLAHAVATIPPDDRPQVRLHGPDYRGGRAQVASLIERLGLERWMEVGGAVYGEEKRQLLRSASGFVYPSRWEAGGISALEAMGLGLPAVLTEYPLGNYMRERNAAFVASPTPADLAAQILRLGDGDAKEVAARGSAIVRDEFNWDTIARTWLRQVQKTLASSLGA